MPNSDHNRPESRSGESESGHNHPGPAGDNSARREFTRGVKEFESADEVAKYKEWRYGTSGQALVDEVERDRLAGLLSQHVGRGPLLALDMPCGYGRISPLLSELDYRLVWGDLAPAMASTTAAHLASSPSIGAFGGDMVALPLAEGSADLTVTIRLWHHLGDSRMRIQILSELARVSRRWSLVSFYDSASLHQLSKGLAKRLQGRTSKITMLSRRQFSAEAKEAGLRVHAFRAVARGFHAHTFALMARQVGGA